ncbi:MAG: glycosyltransferase family 4 protein, partial [Pyrinomonadaceae bacterium]|nr:glycosyltransferase family 4 protein [Pyrinomonadaceae bacterium]
VGRYLLNVVKNWTPEMVGGRFDEINFYTPKPIDRNEIPLPENFNVRVLPSDKPMLVWENTLMARTADDDVVFCPSYTRPLFVRGKTVVVTHDAVQQIYPELFPMSVRLFYNRLYGWSARNATIVVTDSEAARQDIARGWGVPLSRIRVVYLAPAEIFKPLMNDERVSEVREQYAGSSAPFFLFVGKLSGRRNIPLILKAFAEFKRQESFPHKLLLIGLNIHDLDISKLISELGLSDEVRHCEYVSDEDLNLLYNAAEGFISPSTYETVSLPVMEAQATATPVICIDTAGMREITGEAAVLIPKLEVPEMVEAMLRLVSNADLRRELSEKSLANAQRFSWQRCSAETLAVIEEAARIPSTARSLDPLKV